MTAVQRAMIDKKRDIGLNDMFRFCKTKVVPHCVYGHHEFPLVGTQVCT